MNHRDHLVFIHIVLPRVKPPSIRKVKLQLIAED